MTANKGMLTSNTDDWGTPQWLFDKYNEQFNFDIDVCASPHNHKCNQYFTKEDDGLKMEWEGRCWCNPPYGRQIGLWMEKAYKSSIMGATVVCLVPARTDTKWWCNWACKGNIKFIKGRLKFNDGNGSATFPSAIIVYPARKPTWGIFDELDIITKINIWTSDKVSIMAPWLVADLNEYWRVAGEYKVTDIDTLHKNTIYSLN